MIKYMNDIDLTSIRTVEDFLQVLSLQWLGETLSQHGISSLEQMLDLTPTAMQEMGITAGQRQRLLRAIEMLRSSMDTKGSSADAQMREAEVVGSPRQPYNSTSSLYIDSTISAPDFTQLCFCVSLLVYDLILEGEAVRQANDDILMMDEACANPLNNLHPKEIFSAAKRSREEFEASSDSLMQTEPAAPGCGSASSSSLDDAQPPSSAQRLMQPAATHLALPPMPSSSMPAPPPRPPFVPQGSAQPMLHPTPMVQAPPCQPQSAAIFASHLPVHPQMGAVPQLPPVPMFADSAAPIAPDAHQSLSSHYLPAWPPVVGGQPPVGLPPSCQPPSTSESAAAQLQVASARQCEPVVTGGVRMGEGGAGSAGSSLNDSFKENSTPRPPQMPTEVEIRSSIIEMHALTHFTPGCLVVSMIYVERLRRNRGAQLLSSTWQPTIFAALLLAQKVWEDEIYHRRHIDFTQLNEALTKTQLAQLERDFLTALDYNVGVKAAVYTDWYFRLCTLAERNDLRVRPLDQNEARRLEIRGAIMESHLRSSVGTRAHSGPVSGAEATAPSPRSRAVVS